MTQGNDSDNESQDELQNDSKMESYDIPGMRDPCQKAGYRGINAQQIAFLLLSVYSDSNKYKRSTC